MVAEHHCQQAQQAEDDAARMRAQERGHSPSGELMSFGVICSSPSACADAGNAGAGGSDALVFPSTTGQRARLPGPHPEKIGRAFSVSLACSRPIQAASSLSVMRIVPASQLHFALPSGCACQVIVSRPPGRGENACGPWGKKCQRPGCSWSVGHRIVASDRGGP